MKLAGRNSVNFLVDFAGFVNFASLVFTGFVIKYVLPPGTGGRGKVLNDGYGREHIMKFRSMTRHEWGDVHFQLAVIFAVLILLHIVLHWNWIKGYCKSTISARPTSRRGQ